MRLRTLMFSCLVDNKILRIMLVLTNVPDINIRGKWVKDIRGLSVLCVQLFNFLKKNWNNLKYIIKSKTKTRLFFLPVILMTGRDLTVQKRLL